MRAALKITGVCIVVVTQLSCASHDDPESEDGTLTAIDKEQPVFSCNTSGIVWTKYGDTGAHILARARSNTQWYRCTVQCGYFMFDGSETRMECTGLVGPSTYRSIHFCGRSADTTRTGYKLFRSYDRKCEKIDPPDVTPGKS